MRTCLRRLTSPMSRFVYKLKMLINVLIKQPTQIAAAHGLLLARVARVDFPQNWPSLVSDLLEIVRSPPDALVQLRAAPLAQRLSTQSIRSRA